MARKAMNKTLRLQVYQKLLNKVKAYIKKQGKKEMYEVPYSDGLCTLIDDITNKMKISDIHHCDPYTLSVPGSPCLLFYPELLKQADTPDRLYYWERSEEGWNKRLEVVQNAIKKLS